MKRHFELPLKAEVDPCDATLVYVVEPEVGNTIFKMDADNTDEDSSVNQDDANYICTAVNRHESLVAALSLCLQALSANESTLRLTNNWGTAEREAERAARRALGHLKHDTITKDTSVR